MMPLWSADGGAIQLSAAVIESTAFAVTLVGGLDGAAHRCINQYLDILAIKQVSPVSAVLIGR